MNDTNKMNTPKMKDLWYDHIIANKKLWPTGVTLKRLEKARESVLSDLDIMSDLLIRHNGITFTPEDLLSEKPDIYWHGVNNFACNILYKMMNTGIIKSKNK